MVARADELFLRPFGNGGLSRAFGLALLLEATLTGGAVWWLAASHHVMPAAVLAPMRLSEVTLPPAPLKAPLPTPKPVAKPRPQPKPLPKPKPHHVHHRLPPKPRPVARPVVPVKPVAQPPVAPRAAPVVAASPAAMALFEGQVKAAVRAAVRYPPAARLFHRQGQARVAFDYLDGRVSAVRLDHSSGYPLLDRAALVAVRSAAYPPPLAPLQHRQLHLTVWVQFRELDD